MKEFIAEAANDNDDRLESVDDAAQILGIESREDYIPGMNVKLRPHQIIGVAWSVFFVDFYLRFTVSFMLYYTNACHLIRMVGQEKGKVRGGILADDVRYRNFLFLIVSP